MFVLLNLEWLMFGCWYWYLMLVIDVCVGTGLESETAEESAIVFQK